MKRILLCSLILIYAYTAAAQGVVRDDAIIKDYYSASITAPPESLGFDPYYKKYTDANGIPILSSEKVPDTALLVARDIINYMLLERPDLRAALIGRNMRIGVMALSETTTDIPEHRNMKKPGPDDRRLTEGEKSNYARIAAMTDKEYWDRRARGMGGNPTTCAEENLLGYPGTRYYGENILVHEFAHAIMGNGIRRVDPDMYNEIRTAYEEAMVKGLFKGHYGATNANEYWAEGTQFWFWSNYEYKEGDTIVYSPDDLKRYDPKLYELLSRVYPADHHNPMDVYYNFKGQGRKR
ncbi:glycoside hydrolase [candidate division KSB1 bacterium]